MYLNTIPIFVQKGYVSFWCAVRFVFYYQPVSLTFRFALENVSFCGLYIYGIAVLIIRLVVPQKYQNGVRDPSPGRAAGGSASKQ